MIDDIKTALKSLARAKEDFQVGELSRSYSSYEPLAYYVCSQKAKNTVDAESLQALRKEVEMGLSGFSFCANEALWEKSSDLMSIFSD